MQPNDIPSKAEVTARFERDLTELIASAFASGAAIERTWEVSVPVADAPNWTVRIEKTYSDDDPAYDPEFID